MQSPRPAACPTTLQTLTDETAGTPGWIGTEEHHDRRKTQQDHDHPLGCLSRDFMSQQPVHHVVEQGDKYRQTCYHDQRPGDGIECAAPLLDPEPPYLGPRLSGGRPHVATRHDLPIRVAWSCMRVVEHVYDRALPGWFVRLVAGTL